MPAREPFGYDARVKNVRRGVVRPSLVRLVSGLVALPFAALLACGAPEDDDAGVVRFQGQPASPSPLPNTATPPAGTPPEGALPAGDPNTPGNEGTPPTAGLDPSGVGAAPGGGDPVANPGATPPEPETGATPPDPVTPAPSGGSTGCALGNAAPDLNVPNTIVTLPTGYDGNTPLPLLFAFHGANRTNTQMRMDDSRTVGSGLESTYVMAFVKSAGTAWDLNTDYPRFEAVLDQMLAQFCVDETHLFAMGHSSGAQFIAQMLGTRGERRFAGVTPVSSSNFGATWDPVPTLLIHGLNDLERLNDLDGAQDIAQYTRSNQCAATFQAVSVPTCTTIAGTNAQVDPGCRQYDGCSVPTLFCNHDDPNYVDGRGATNHGWPCFANAQILSFFESLR
jgi:polyhydroxybutyrate depolymerase